MVEFHIFMSYTNARTWVKFNGLMDVNYPKGEEENDYTLSRKLVNLFCIFKNLVKPFHLLGSWSSHSTFLES